MNWISLNTESQLQELILKSMVKVQVIFKHSIRCSISSVVKDRLERKSAPPDVDFHYLDLINYRELSRLISERFSVEHESPQILVIRNGQCIYHESHMGIRMDEISVQLMAE